MSTPTPPPNYSLHSLPLSFLFALTPHAYVTARLMSLTANTSSKAMPRTNLEAWKSRLPVDTWNHLMRARGAHLNSLEVWPLFAAAVIAGNVAQLPAKDMNSMALGFCEARALYVALYLSIKSDRLAYARTAAYAWSIAIPIVGLWRAGNVFAARGGD